ncbi:polysaccharide transporter, PST family [Roseovarius marisflavi]|uniref:Polysaccharide transporter, PST family n=1 Tax=Roseovarius marisflavi TaxID=1054996 RepID=A0A1M7CFG9_9RHOB|nr:O-antigen translocase [Roseovarius marisflavi]SHL65930.1 polysaccharide transporter, PST family [Roseovarius marisflavi]
MSARGLLKSMAIIGSAQAVRILITIVRAKLVAILLGPTGIGLLSVFNNLHEMASMSAGLGLGTSGVREISSAKGEEVTLSRVRRVLFGALVLQGLVAMAAIWLARDTLALWLLDSTDHATEVGLVGVAVFLFLVAGSQTALLQGMRRIGDLGRVTVWSTLFGSASGLLAVWLLGLSGLIWLILLPPLASILVAWHYTRRLPPPTSVRMTPREIWQAWRPMVALGVVFTLGGLATTGTLLLVRTRITQELGLEAAGQFAAAWSVSMIYVGFLLQAMGTDYFPRLTEVIHDRDAANQLMNDQIQLGLALGGPLLLVLIGCAPWLIRLLYSAKFDASATLLQWQTVGNVFKLASWPLGFALVAAARSGIFLVTQLLFNVLFLPAIWFGLPFLGLEVTGIAFLLAYVILFAVIAILVRQLHGFRWEGLSLGLVAGHAGLALALLALARAAPLAGAGASAALGLITAFVGGHIVITKIGSHGRLVSRVARIYEMIGWPIRDIK